MTPEQFKHLVASLELDASVAPKEYRYRTAALAGLGYLYILLLLVLCLSLLVWGLHQLLSGHVFIGIKILLGCGIFTVLLIRALWVPLHVPQGHKLSHDVAPSLFELIEKVRARCNGPVIHDVLLVDELNASICQTPRLGLLGWHHNTLSIGLPLLQVLNTHQFTAILAHEYGHLASAHGKIGAWIYRIRETWSRLYDTLEEDDSLLSKVSTHFFRWYIPYFQAYSFVLARQQEYQADQLAAQIVGPQSVAQALISLHTYDDFLSTQYWPKIWAQADQQMTPALLPNKSMLAAIKVGASTSDAQAALDQALKERTGTSDTHPSLTQRLDALGQTPHLPEPVIHTAAQVLLGKQLPTLIQQLDNAWWQSHKESWQTHCKDVQEANLTITELGPHDPLHLSAPDLTRLGLARMTLGDEDDALKLLIKGADHREGTPLAAFHAGRILLDQDDPRGLIYLDLARTRDPDCTYAACELALHYCERSGDEGRARNYQELLAGA